MKFLLIDEQPIVLTGLSIFLREQFNATTIIVADSFSSYHSRHNAAIPDIIIVGLPKEAGGIGLHVFKTMLSTYPNAAFVAYACQADYHQAISFLRLGVSGYISKNDPMSDLAKCLTLVGSGESYLRPQFLNIAFSEYMKSYESGRNKPVQRKRKRPVYKMRS